LEDEKNKLRPWKKKLKSLGKWGLIAFILFEISQIIIGVYLGVKFALTSQGISF
jgi:hypothetical protein